MVRAVLRVKKLTQNARLPTRGSPHSAGLDLYACEESSVPSLGKALVPTGLSIACPPGCYARIAPRSGLAWKNHIDVGAGVVDADYRGPVGVVLFNHSSEALQVKVGDRIAQLILEKIEYPEVVQVEDLEATERGSGGFGSTGVASNPEPDAPEQTEIEKVQDTNKRQKMESGDDAHRNDLDEAKGEMLVALESGDFSQEEKMQLKKLVVNDKERVNPIAFAFLKLKDEAVMVRDLRLLL